MARLRWLGRFADRLHAVAVGARCRSGARGRGAGFAALVHGSGRMLPDAPGPALVPRGEPRCRTIEYVGQARHGTCIYERMFESPIATEPRHVKGKAGTGERVRCSSSLVPAQLLVAPGQRTTALRAHRPNAIGSQTAVRKRAPCAHRHRSGRPTEPRGRGFSPRRAIVPTCHVLDIAG